MKLSQLILLTLLLAAIGAALAVTKNKSMPVETRDLFIPLKLKVDADAVREIMINRGEESIELKKNERGWQISNLWNAPVENDKISALLKLVSYIEGEQRSKDENLLGDYGLQTDDAYHLKLMNSQNKELVYLLIGTHQPDELSVFVRKPGDNAVYLSQMPLLRAMDIYEDALNAKLNKQYWASLTLVDDDFDAAAIDKIQMVHIERNNISKELSLKKKDGVWAMDYPVIPFEMSQAKIADLIKAATEGQAIRVVDPNGDYGFEQDYWRVTFQGAKSLIYDIAQKQDSYYLRQRNKETVFEISSHQANRLTNGPVHFIEDNPFDIQVGEIKEILMRYKESEMFINTTAEYSNTLNKIVPLFKNFELQLEQIKDPKIVENFAENVPYEIVLRHADGKTGKAIGFGEPDVKTGRYPLQVQGRSEVYSVAPDLFKKIFLPFTTELKTKDIIQAAAGNATAVAETAGKSEQP